MLTRIHTQAIVKLMQTAKLHIEYPKVRLQSDDITIQLSVAGPHAKMPNSINITDSKAFEVGQFYGRIKPDGELMLVHMATNLDTLIKHELKLFAEQPTQYAKLYSNVTGNCMFCCRELTDPQSVAVGYGPVCAGNFGLPHGEVEKEIANDIAQIEMEMPEVISTEKPQTLEDKVAYLELKVEQLEAILYRIQSNGE